MDAKKRTSWSEIRSFLALCNAKRRFIPEFMRMPHMPNKVLWKGAPIIFEQKEEILKSIKAFIEKICSPPFICSPSAKRIVLRWYRLFHVSNSLKHYSISRRTKSQTHWILVLVIQRWKTQLFRTTMIVHRRRLPIKRRNIKTSPYSPIIMHCTSCSISPSHSYAWTVGDYGLQNLISKSNARKLPTTITPTPHSVN